MQSLHSLPRIFKWETKVLQLCFANQMVNFTTRRQKFRGYWRVVRPIGALTAMQPGLIHPPWKVQYSKCLVGSEEGSPLRKLDFQNTSLAAAMLQRLPNLKRPPQGAPKGPTGLWKIFFFIQSFRIWEPQSKLASRGPQNSRRGLECCLHLGFWAI